MRNKTKYTVAEASELLGFSSRSTLNKKTKDGTLSYDKDINGVKTIDASELARVFPDLYNKAMSETTDAQYSPTKKAQENTPSTAMDQTAVLQILIKQTEQLREDLERERNQNIERENRLYSEKNELMGLVKNQNLMLTHQPIPAQPEKAQKLYALYKWPIIITGGLAWIAFAAYLIKYYL